MNNKVVFTVALVIGAGVGVLSSWRYMKNKYETIAKEDIESVKSVYSKERNETLKQIKELSKAAADEVFEKMPNGNKISSESLKEMSDRNKEKISVEEYASRLGKEGYTNYSDISKTETKTEKTPYVISPDEFGEDLEFDKISLTYYSDDILADDRDEIIDDVDGVIGEESLDYFGEYEDDVVFVKNDRLKSYFEIFREHRTFDETVYIRPHGME